MEQCRHTAGCGVEPHHRGQSDRTGTAYAGSTSYNEGKEKRSYRERGEQGKHVGCVLRDCVYLEQTWLGKFSIQCSNELLLLIYA